MWGKEKTWTIHCCPSPSFMQNCSIKFSFALPVKQYTPTENHRARKQESCDSLLAYLVSIDIDGKGKGVKEKESQLAWLGFRHHVNR